jgi:hypothetical protein
MMIALYLWRNECGWPSFAHDLQRGDGWGQATIAPKRKKPWNMVIQRRLGRFREEREGKTISWI